MKLKYKKCSLKDLDMLVDISKTTFVSAFEKDNNPEDFESYIISAFSKEQLKAELLDGNSTFIFAYYDALLVGYFKLNQNEAQTEFLGNQALELERIYVIDPFQGKGIGKQILDYIIQLSKQKQMSFLWLGVWQENKKAIQFYEREGFIKFGTHPYYIGKDKQTDWLMKLELG